MWQWTRIAFLTGLFILLMTPAFREWGKKPIAQLTCNELVTMLWVVLTYWLVFKDDKSK